MELELRRETKTPASTIGRLLVNGVFQCWTLEDAVRDGPKVPGATAIPAGQYKVEVTWSPRFQQMMPLVEDVPGYSGIRIHPGNTDKDTEGCILVGVTRGQDRIYQSQQAYHDLLNRLNGVKEGEEIWLVIE